MTQRRNRQIVLVYLALILVFTAGMTLFVAPKMVEMRRQARDKQVLYKCVDVFSGDTIRVQQRHWDGENPHPVVVVRLAGIEAPPSGDQLIPATLAFSEATGLPPSEIAPLAISSRNTLQSYLRRQNLMLRYPNGDRVETNLTGDIYAHVLVYGIDAGHKQVKSGLARHAPDLPQAYSDLYARDQEQARKQGYGIWSRYAEKANGN